ncbi:MAG: acriflavin resistance protein [Rhodospirillaceae bacterium TMED8]|nr:acriflavin resistance protein [Magnetovibrio sp.]OUT50894.1 MAG: acriflavin resistance protein [Rhodospirillaceae bacterium TMED8]
MNIISTAIDRPVAVLAAVLMVVMFGFVAFNAIPIQLTPDVRKPIINLQTIWPGAAPAEIEREIINRQEEVLRGLEGLQSMISQAQDGRGRITLEFGIGHNMERALLLVANRLDRVSGYPDEAREPTIRTSSSDDNPITWIVFIRDKENDRAIHTYGDYVEDIVQDRLERVEGVSRVNVYGGAATQMEVSVEPSQLARYQLNVTEVVQKLRAANSSVSAGDLDEGKRRYVVRTEGEFANIEDVKSVLLRSAADSTDRRVARVTVGDIASVRLATKNPTSRIRFNGQPAMAVNAVREHAANVIEVMEGIRAAILELNAGPLSGNKVKLIQVYDETVYIKSSIRLVQQNIVIGGTLAALMLLIFLRSGSATLIVSLAIPVSVIGAFVAMAAMGRSINVISLAGIAFAVGMVVDAAIVVLENIYRFREKGMSPRESAYLGTRQVWTAVLVSALTTVMVFIPVLVMELEMGQLFRDIAVALSVSVILSLIVGVTVIPALSNRLLGSDRGIRIRRVRIPIIDDFAIWFVRVAIRYTSYVIQRRNFCAFVVILICGASAAATWAFLPKLDYLPNGNRNLIFGRLVPPPGYNLATTTEIASDFESELLPFLSSGPNDLNMEDGTPKLQRFFFVASRGRTFVGAAAADPNRVAELLPIMRRAVYKEPGTLGGVVQRSLFGRGIGGSRSIELNISGPDLEDILNVANIVNKNVGLVLPRAEGTQVRPVPGLVLGAPEVRVIPDRIKLADNGVSAQVLGETIDAFNNGLRVAEITIGAKRMDLMLQGKMDKSQKTQSISNIPVVTSDGRVIPTKSLATIEITSGPTQIRHLNRERTVTLFIIPPSRMPLEEALDILKVQVIDKLRISEALPTGIKFTLTGAADKLKQTWNAMIMDLIIAIIIVYLVMAILFESFFYPLIIMLSVPLATGGGVLALALVNTQIFQPLDMLTLLGFVILIGIVVNNAILLVHQTLFHIRTEGYEICDAVLEATKNRIRPIFMSSLTSIFGMLPLVIFPGSGSELYRGLGTVVVGGLSMSAILTLAIIPPLLILFAGVLEKQK